MKRVLGLMLLVLVTAGWLVLRSQRDSSSDPGEKAVRTTMTERPSSATAESADAAAELRRRLSELPAESAEERAARERAIAEMIGTDRSRAWFNLPLRQIHDDLKAAAEGGDMRAAHVLGSRLAQCNRVLRERTPSALLEELERDRDFESAYDADTRRFRLMNLQRRLAADLERYEDCAAIPSESRSRALAWLEMAGSSGDLAAKLAFVDAWSAQASDRGALIADIERVAAQRDLARQWLQQALEAGDEGALAKAITAHSGAGGLYPRNEVRELAFAYAQQLVQGRRTGEFDTLWKNGPGRYGDRLTPRDWDAVETQGREIFTAYFAQRPAWPNGSPTR